MIRIIKNSKRLRLNYNPTLVMDFSRGKIGNHLDDFEGDHPNTKSFLCREFGIIGKEFLIPNIPDPVGWIKIPSVSLKTSYDWIIILDDNNPNTVFEKYIKGHHAEVMKLLDQLTTRMTIKEQAMNLNTKYTESRIGSEVDNRLKTIESGKNVSSQKPKTSRRRAMGFDDVMD